MTKKHWIVFTGKEEYKLTESQYQFMQTENNLRGKTIFWFDHCTINLSMHTSMRPVFEQVDELPQLPAQSAMERESARVRIAEIKAKLKKKLEEKK